MCVCDFPLLHFSPSVAQANLELMSKPPVGTLELQMCHHTCPEKLFLISKNFFLKTIPFIWGQGTHVTWCACGNQGIEGVSSLLPLWNPDLSGLAIDVFTCLAILSTDKDS